VDKLAEFKGARSTYKGIKQTVNVNEQTRRVLNLITPSDVDPKLLNKLREYARTKGVEVVTEVIPR
jgi:hypothetical protein